MEIYSFFTNGLCRMLKKAMHVHGPHRSDAKNRNLAKLTDRAHLYLKTIMKTKDLVF